jgi:hypothetical protein
LAYRFDDTNLPLHCFSFWLKSWVTQLAVTRLGHLDFDLSFGVCIQIIEFSLGLGQLFILGSLHSASFLHLESREWCFQGIPSRVFHGGAFSLGGLINLGGKGFISGDVGFIFAWDGFALTAWSKWCDGVVPSWPNSGIEEAQITSGPFLRW